MKGLDLIKKNAKFLTDVDRIKGTFIENELKKDNNGVNFIKVRSINSHLNNYKTYRSN